MNYCFEITGWFEAPSDEQAQATLDGFVRLIVNTDHARDISAYAEPIEEAQ